MYACVWCMGVDRDRDTSSPDSFSNVSMDTAYTGTGTYIYNYVSLKIQRNSIKYCIVKCICHLF